MTKNAKSPSAAGDEAQRLAASHGKLIKRSAAARLLNISVSTLRRYEDELHPIIGPKGVRLFDEVTLRSAAGTLRRRRVLETAGPTAGETAADVFTLLDEAVSAVDIVKRLRVAPDLVAALQSQWAEMRGGFVVSKDEAFDLGMLARRQPRSAAEAVANLRRHIALLRESKQGSQRCQYCRQQMACSCELCAVELRGPIVVFATRLEQRENPTGETEVRVAIDASWCDDVIDPSGSSVATLRSDWVREVELLRSDIADIASGAGVVVIRAE